MIKPVIEQGADELFVGSGYATAAMTFHHFQQLRDNYLITGHLIVGMTVQIGLSLSNYRGFQDLTMIWLVYLNAVILWSHRRCIQTTPAAVGRRCEICEGWL